MAGIYVHIPFCKQACHYCDFHFSVSYKLRKEMITAICKEIALRKDYLKTDTIDTLYFGGGTPSTLAIDEVEVIFNTIRQYFRFNNHVEITFEANPDDLSIEYLAALKSLGINRLSIGIQSFNDDLLKSLNRRHSGMQAVRCIENAQKVGFTNITADLIYGIPSMTEKDWIADLEKMFSLDIPHLSCYHLTIEPKTTWGVWQSQGKIKPVEEALSVRFFEMLIDKTQKAGFEQYEISNFAKPNFYAKHNSAYWTGTPYLGVGASAHSFDGVSRQWNEKINANYIRKINADECFYEIENLSTKDLYNEYVMTGLRTSKGISMDVIQSRFGEQFSTSFLKSVTPFVEEQLVVCVESNYVLSNQGKFVSDYVIEALFVV